MLEWDGEDSTDLSIITADAAHTSALSTAETTHRNYSGASVFYAMAGEKSGSFFLETVIECCRY